jgi:hypothetical protein
MTMVGVILLDDTERCKHELITQQCGYCRTPPPPSFVEALFDEPGGYDTEDDDSLVASFPAGFGGRCAQCDGFFEIGEWISRTRAGDYWCSECAE